MNTQTITRGIASHLPALVFALVTLLTGLASISAYGPLTIPDPDIHVYASYALATGQIGQNIRTMDDGAGNQVHIQYVRMPSNLRQAPLDNKTVGNILDPVNHENDERFKQWNKLTMADVGSGLKASRANQYSPLSFIPQAVGIGLARATGASMWNQLQVGRISSLLVYCMLGVISVVLVRRLGWLMTVILANPVSVFVASSLSADTLTNTVAALTIALAVKLGVCEKRSTLLIVGLSVCLALLVPLKLCYMPLALLPLALETIRLRDRLLITVIPTAVGIILMCWWSLSYGRIAATVNMSETKKHLVDHPIHDILRSLVGGWNNVWRVLAGHGIMTAAILVILTAFVLTTRKMSFDRKRICVVIAAAILSTTAIAGMLIITWAKPTLPWGVAPFGFQERYLLPLLPLLVFTTKPETSLSK
ncbi:DUF2142 domain-containing protein [Bifidobacterium callitrichidarum]|uniref:DUF2142 domain-containing protein n=1 Tax=Bifidobacterium callitrichidarum TaxID=2052941 RepID=A0A2U2NCC1_9BIFI|nr:DUF2142 domain-containing protein [Bifidobacterium callitrichidarum]PWG66649.1 hypothetical protein DF196_01740 [Bifidobacterium callitrichidarum]